MTAELGTKKQLDCRTSLLMIKNLENGSIHLPKNNILYVEIAKVYSTMQLCALIKSKETFWSIMQPSPIDAP